MIEFPGRPCFYDDWVCADCTGERDDCVRLIARDQQQDDDAA